MFKLWQSVIFLLFILVAVTIEYPDDTRPKVKVGALFFKGEEDIELSFDEAFREINNLKFFELSFSTIKRYIPSDDSFVLQQLTCELISSGVAAIFGPSSKATSDIVALIANQTGIPHLKYDISSDSQQQQERNHHMSINVAPSISVISRAYWDIIRTNYEWRSFTIIYETEEGLMRLQDLMDIQSLNKDFIKLRKLSDFQNDYRVLWKEAAETFHEQRIILDVHPESLDMLMKTAMPFNMLGPFRSWFLTNLDTHSSRLRDIYNEAFRANITAVRIRNVDPNPYERKKTRIQRVDEILGNQTMLPILMYDAVVLYANSARNIITSLNQYTAPYQRCSMDRESSPPWYVGRQIVRQMKVISEDDVEPHFKTENMQINEFGQRTQFHLEIFKPTVNEPMAVWKPDGSITPIRQRIDLQTSASTQDFSQGKKMYTVVTKLGEPYFMLKADHENFRGIEKYEGYAIDLIQKLSELLDFEYDFMIADGTGKYDPEKKEWDGLIRKLIDHQAQIGICDLTITQSRRQVVDFTVPFMQLGISILYYKSQPEPKNLYAFLQPFAMEVWIYMILTQLVMTLLFVFMARISYQEWENPHPCNPDPDEIENKWNTANSTWLMIGSIMQQGCDILPRGPPMRILNGMWWFFALMMLSTYTANLAAFLTSNKMQSSIKSLKDLIDQDSVKYGTVDGGSTSLFFSESNHSDYQKAWNQMKTFKPSVFTKDNAEGVSRVIKETGDYAFLMETTGMSYNIERHCDLKEIGEPIGEKHYGLAVPLGADYRSNLSVSLLQLSEKGELYKLKTKWWKNHNVTCDQPHQVDGDELSIIELGGVFLVLGGGIFVAMVLGICEFLWNVQQVAVEQRLTPGEAFKAELIFAMKFWIKRKPVHIASISSSSKSSRRSSRQSRSHSQGSEKSTKSAKSTKSGKSAKSVRSRKSAKQSKENIKIVI